MVRFGNLMIKSSHFRKIGNADNPKVDNQSKGYLFKNSGRQECSRVS